MPPGKLRHKSNARFLDSFFDLAGPRGIHIERCRAVNCFSEITRRKQWQGTNPIPPQTKDGIDIFSLNQRAKSIKLRRIKIICDVAGLDSDIRTNTFDFKSIRQRL